MKNHPFLALALILCLAALTGCAPFGYSEGHAVNHDWSFELTQAPSASSEASKAAWLVSVRFVRPQEGAMVLRRREGEDLALTRIGEFPPVRVQGAANGVDAILVGEGADQGTVTFTVHNHHSEYVASNPAPFQGGSVGVSSGIEDHLTYEGEFWVIPDTAECAEVIRQILSNTILFVAGDSLVSEGPSEGTRKRVFRPVVEIPASVIRIPVKAKYFVPDDDASIVAMPENPWLSRMALVGNSMPHRLSDK